MQGLKPQHTVFLVLTLLSACQVGLSGPAPLERPQGSLGVRSGGRATVLDLSEEAFSHRFPDMNGEHRTAFFSGESLFDQSWVTAPSSTEARDGLGPFFNARSCAACHAKDGRSNPFNDQGQPTEAVLVRLSAAGKSEASYGNQLQPFAVGTLAGEGRLEISWQELPGSYPDGQRYSLQQPHFTLKDWAYGQPDPALEFSVRQSPQLIGLGLLEQIPESQLKAAADPEDRNQDGISGRLNQVWDLRKQARVIGRFGWKANQPTLEQQVAAAFSGDIGISNPLFPEREQSPAQAPLTAGLEDGGQPELPERLLERVVFYVRNLAVPTQRRPEAHLAQQARFEQLGCAACHQPTQQIPGDTIAPYTDLLLHDMGPELADGRPDQDASGQEWRTPPLWGLGLIPKVNGHSRYLHDGRARSLEEAILWHGGEAQSSKLRFQQLDASQRQAFIAFLESL